MNSDDRIVLENKHEAIISKEDFGKVQEKLNSNPKHITRERKHVHILQDNIYCGHCHHKMSFTVYHGKKSGYYCSYRYKIKDCSCMKGKIVAEILEDIVSREIRFHTEDFLAGEKQERWNREERLLKSGWKKLWTESMYTIRIKWK